jgi:hypothetical protein
LSLSWARRIQSASSHSIPLVPISLLSSHRRQISQFIYFRFPTETLNAFSPSYAYHIPRLSHASWFDHPNYIMFVVK